MRGGDWIKKGRLEKLAGRRRTPRRLKLSIYKTATETWAQIKKHERKMRGGGWIKNKNQLEKLTGKRRMECNRRTLRKLKLTNCNPAVETRALRKRDVRKMELKMRVLRWAMNISLRKRMRSEYMR